MRRFSSPLDQVRIAAPCNADWDRMVGNERVRFCGQCNLNVYNLSEFSKQEAEAFISRNEGRVCARFYRRADGSILTKNCPVGLKTLQRRLSVTATAACTAVITFLAGLGIHNLSRSAFYKPQPLLGVVAQPVDMEDSIVESRDRPVTGTLEIPDKMMITRPKESRKSFRRRITR